MNETLHLLVVDDEMGMRLAVERAMRNFTMSFTNIQCEVCEVNFRISQAESGEAALAVIDSIVRLLPGAISDPESASLDSFETGLLDHPHYTRPEDFEGIKVPEVLRSGNHALIRAWRRRQALLLTRRLRPDLYQRASLSPEDLKLLEETDEDQQP